MWRRFNFDDRHQGVIEYWDFLQTELRRRFGLSMSLLEAAREVVFSPPFRMSAFAGWDSPERIVTNAYSLYRHWAPERAPGRAQSRLKRLSSKPRPPGSGWLRAT